MRLTTTMALFCGMAAFQLQSSAAQLSQRPGDQGVAEQRIGKEVRHELIMLPRYSVFDDLEYKVDGRTVTLFGDATDPTLKSDAEKAVKKIEGVEQVQNQIHVLPL